MYGWQANFANRHVEPCVEQCSSLLIGVSARCNLNQGVRNSEKSCMRFQIFVIFQDFRTFEILHIQNNSIM